MFFVCFVCFVDFDVANVDAVATQAVEERAVSCATLCDDGRGGVAARVQLATPAGFHHRLSWEFLV
jgi:hypothetical protein